MSRTRFSSEQSRINNNNNTVLLYGNEAISCRVTSRGDDKKKKNWIFFEFGLYPVLRFRPLVHCWFKIRRKYLRQFFILRPFRGHATLTIFKAYALFRRDLSKKRKKKLKIWELKYYKERERKIIVLTLKNISIHHNIGTEFFYKCYTGFYYRHFFRENKTCIKKIVSNLWTNELFVRFGI